MALVALLLSFPRLTEIVGGREIRSFHTMVTLASKGWLGRVIVVALDNGRMMEDAYGVLVIRPRRLLGPLAFPLAPIIVLLAALTQGPGTVVYIPHPPPIGIRILDAATIMLLGAASRLGLVKLWVNIHDPFLLQIEHKNKGSRLAPGDSLISILEPLLLGSASHVTAASRSIALYYSPYTRGKNVGIYYAGVSRHLVPTAARMGQREVCLVGYVGSPYDEQLDLAAEAVRASKMKARLVVMTSIPGGSLDSIHGYDSRVVRVIWGVKYADFPRVSEYIDVYILPRRLSPLTKTTLPNKYPMYLASKRPVVATATPEIKLYNAFLENLCGRPDNLWLAESPDDLPRLLEAACNSTVESEHIALCMAGKASWEANLERAMRGAGLLTHAT